MLCGRFWRAAILQDCKTSWIINEVQRSNGVTRRNLVVEWCVHVVQFNSADASRCLAKLIRSNSIAIIQSESFTEATGNCRSCDLLGKSKVVDRFYDIDFVDNTKDQFEVVTTIVQWGKVLDLFNQNLSGSITISVSMVSWSGGGSPSWRSPSDS